MLFGVMYLGTALYMRSGDELPEGLLNPKDLMTKFHIRSAECLILSKYSTQPGKYTLEALLLNGHVEYTRQPVTTLGLWVLGSITIRLAMRMGYHRDPSGYGQISAFDGEMRRRTWALILQLDTLTSYQVGLPAMVQESQYDTKLPRNLFDEDLKPESADLPPSRLESELTPVLYTIVKGRILAVFSAIFSQVSLVRHQTPEEIMALDQKLRLAYESVPQGLRIASPQDSLMVPPHVLIRRYNLELLFHKSRCILHRHHMAKSYQSPGYEYSRQLCVEAAMMLLMHLDNILTEVQPGGMLFHQRWFITSLEHHDFLLASMVVCLELSRRLQVQTSPWDEVSPASGSSYSREQLISAVQSSQRFWDTLQEKSVEAMQANRLISMMLGRVSGGPATFASQGPGSISIPTTTTSSASNDEAFSSFDPGKRKMPALF
jgi:hypothetical protein